MRADDGKWGMDETVDEEVDPDEADDARTAQMQLQAQRTRSLISSR